MGLRKEGGPSIDPPQSALNNSTLALPVQYYDSFTTSLSSYRHFFFSIHTQTSLRLYPCATQLWTSPRILLPENTASKTTGSADMAASGAEGFAPVLAALSTMQSNAERSQKSQAHEYLEKFQKSVRRTKPSSLHSVNHTDVNVARSLVNDTFNIIYHGRHGRSKAVCCDDIERKGKRFTEESAGARLTIHTDYV